MALRYHVLLDSLRLGPLAERAKGGALFGIQVLDVIPGMFDDRDSVS
jgi:hypothetical protein